eukprot:COSAG02_NODE_22_length_53020_cov_16.223125_53_plen_401_part_00
MEPAPESEPIEPKPQDACTAVDGNAPVPADMRDEAWLEQVNAHFETRGLPVRLARRDGCGVGAFATRDIRCGELLGVDQPVACTPCNEAVRSVCAGCLRGNSDGAGGAGGAVLPEEGEALELCVGCGKVSFCLVCRGIGFGDSAAEWHRSSLECTALSHAPLDQLTPAVSDLCRQLIQLMARQPSSGTALLTSLLTNTAGTIRPRGYGDARLTAADAAKEAIAAACMRDDAAARGSVSYSWCEEALRGVLDRQQANAMGVFGPQCCDVAVCLFAGLFHLFNHSCIPNVALDNRPQNCPDQGSPWWAPTFGYRALRDIAADTELVICYTSTTESTAVRAEELWANYGFKCNCRRCTSSDLDELDIMEQMDEIKCLNGLCGGFVIPETESGTLRCLRCSAAG